MNPIIPLKTFFENPDLSQFQLSPDGTQLAYCKKIENHIHIFVIPILVWQEEKDLSQGQRFTFFEDRDIYDYGWIDNQFIYFLKDEKGNENYHLYLLNTFDGAIEEITPDPKTKVNFVDALIEEKMWKKKSRFHNKILVGHNQRDPRFFDCYLYDYVTKTWEIIFQKDQVVHNLVFDDNFEVMYYGIPTIGKTQIFGRVNAQDEFQLMLEYDSQSSFGFVSYVPHKGVYVMDNLTSDKVVLNFYNFQLEKQQTLYENPNVDLTYAYIDQRHDYKLVSISYFYQYPTLHYFDTSAEAKYELIKNLITQQFSYEKNNFFRLVDTDLLRNKYIVRSTSDCALEAYYYVDLTDQTVIALRNKHKWLNSDYLSRMQPIQFQARDGLMIHGYLTLPRNYSTPQEVPLIVNVHGGPWHRDYWGYDPQVQFFANRGYGVLQINFRISTGYGKDFFVRGWKQWGLAIQDDITDGTLWAIQQGYTSVEQVAIYGGSFGGYATLMGIIREPDLYAAAVDYVGVSDLFSFYDSFPPYWMYEGNIFDEAMGNPHKNPEFAKAVSPIYHVDKIKTPLMVVHGANDPRVTLHQAELIVNTLKAKGIEVEYLLKEDEGHGFYNETNQFELYTKMEAFFDKHLKKIITN